MRSAHWQTSSTKIREQWRQCTHHTHHSPYTHHTQLSPYLANAFELRRFDCRDVARSYISQAIDSQALADLIKVTCFSPGCQNILIMWLCAGMSVLKADAAAHFAAFRGGRGCS
jgi:hypothetical protein